jgi:hypothetical protein
MGKCRNLKANILSLRDQGKTYKEIRSILSCSESIIAYYCGTKWEGKKQKMKEYRDSGKAKFWRDEYNKRNREYINNYLSDHPCVDCGNNDLRVLEFDHVRGEKEDNIGNASQKSWSIEKLQKEIEKCEVRCANCHRIATHERRITNKLKIVA